jgi:hypothetical protein
MPGDNIGRVCPADDKQLELEVRNTAYTQRCASVQLERARIALQLTRRIVDTIVRATWYFNSMVLSLLRLMLPGITEDMVSDAIIETQFWFVSLVDIVFESIREGANLLFRIIFDSGGFGTAFKEVLMAVCKMVNWALQAWNMTWCVILRDVISPVIGLLIDILAPVISFFSSGSGEIVNLLRSVQSSIANMPCNETLPCFEPRSTPFRAPDGSLPVATRCWADYVPEVDDTDALSCTRSDTCRAQHTYYGPAANPQAYEEVGAGVGQEVLCNACPWQEGGYIKQYGCDTLTRQCTCNVPKRDRTFCTANEQCMVQASPSPHTHTPHTHHTPTHTPLGGMPFFSGLDFDTFFQKNQFGVQFTRP